MGTGTTSKTSTTTKYTGLYKTDNRIYEYFEVPYFIGDINYIKLDISSTNTPSYFKFSLGSSVSFRFIGS